MTSHSSALGILALYQAHKHQRDATEPTQIFISRLLQNVVNTQPWIKTKTHMNHHTVWHIVQDSRLGVLERRRTKVRKGLIKYKSNKNKTILDILTHIERIWSLLDAYADTASRCWYGKYSAEIATFRGFGSTCPPVFAAGLYTFFQDWAHQNVGL